MHENDYSVSKKHREFVSSIRNVMATPELEIIPDILLTDDAYTELDTDSLLELEELMDSLFDSLD